MRVQQRESEKKEEKDEREREERERRERRERGEREERERRERDLSEFVYDLRGEPVVEECGVEQHSLRCVAGGGVVRLGVDHHSNGLSYAIHGGRRKRRITNEVSAVQRQKKATDHH